MCEGEVSLSPVFYLFSSLCFSPFIFFIAFFLAMEVWYKSLPKISAVLLDLPGQLGGFFVRISDASLNEARLWVSSLGPAMVKQYAADSVLSVAVSSFLHITS